MKLIRKEINDGVICNYAVTDQFQSNYISIDFILPLTLENATGMSLLAGVMSRGCKAFPRMDEISRFLAKNYGASMSINAGKAGEMEIFTMAVNYLDNSCAIDGEDIQKEIFFFLREMILEPLAEKGAFSEEYVAGEKKNLLDKMAAVFNDKRIFSLQRCKELMCFDEAYGINELGDQATVDAFDAKSLFEFYKNMIDHALIVISCVGNQEGIMDTFAQQFASRKVLRMEALIKSAGNAVREVIEPMNLNQSKLNLGFRLGKLAQKNGAACRLFNVLYGGSANSKLFMNVREKLSLCYYCSSTIDRFKNVMYVSSGIESPKYQQAREEIEAQLHSIAIGDFSDEEFENAKSYLIDSVRGSSDSKSVVGASMVSGTLRGEMQTIEEEIEDISSVGRDAIQKIAQETILDTVYLLKGVQSKE